MINPNLQYERRPKEWAAFGVERRGKSAKDDQEKNQMIVLLVMKTVESNTLRGVIKTSINESSRTDKLITMTFG